MNRRGTHHSWCCFHSQRKCPRRKPGRLRRPWTKSRPGRLCSWGLQDRRMFRLGTRGRQLHLHESSGPQRMDSTGCPLLTSRQRCNWCTSVRRPPSWCRRSTRSTWNFALASNCRPGNSYNSWRLPQTRCPHCMECTRVHQMQRTFQRRTRPG